MSDFEFYETPQTSVRYLFRSVQIEGRCFEPCVGSGAILRGASFEPGARLWRTNDLDPRWRAGLCVDATSPDLWSQVRNIDWTVTNTPFSAAVEIIDHALRHSSEGVAAYLRISMHEVLKGGLRRSWFADHPPSEIHFLPRFAHQRSQKTGKWSTDSVSTCWTVWRHGDPSQRIRYAPECVIDGLDAETPHFRARMDALMKERPA